MTESEFLAVAEAVLDHIESRIEQTADVADVDVECSRSGNVLEIEFIDQNSRFGEIKVGALVITSGGAASLAPRGVVVGRVIKITERSGTSGAALEVRLSARLSTLNFLRVLLYQPVAGG